MDRISSIPFQTGIHTAARASGARAVSVTPVAQSTQGAARTEPLARIGLAHSPKPASDPSRLVAARVDPIDLTTDVAGIGGRPTDGSLPMYRHPADRNQAATGVALGRSLDVRG